MSNAHSDLSKNLNSGELGHHNIQIAYRAWIKQREDIPNELNDLLCGKKHSGGLLYEMFTVIHHTIGNVELAYRRGYQAGQEDANQSQEKEA